MSDAPKEPKQKKPQNGPRELNPRQREFCEHYIKTSNGVQSARSAGYRGSPQVLASSASELLLNPKVKEYLTVLQDKISAPRILSAQRRLELLSDIVTGEANGKALVMGELVEDKPSFSDKIRASELMSKMLGELSETRNQSGEVVIRVERSNKSAISLGGDDGE